MIKQLTGNRGVTLLELAVVAAIIAVLSTLAAVGVTSAVSTTRGTTKVSDASEVGKAIQNYAGQHPSAEYPTINGCLPGQSYSVSTKTCVAGTDPGAYNIEIPATYMAIIWGKGYKTPEGITRTFVPGFLQSVPKHSFEHNDGTEWSTALTSDPESIITEGFRIPDGTKIPVWVIDRNGVAHITISDSDY